ncbi:MAG: glycosyltransferase family 4 protein [Parvularculaceae bacterium]
MRIVYYVLGWPPDRFPNGVVSAVSALAPAVRKAGHSAQVLAYYGEPAPGEPDVQFVEAALGRPREFPPLRVLRDRLSPHRRIFTWAAKSIAHRLNEAAELKCADILEIEESFGWSAQVARATSMPIVTRLHGPYFLTGAAGRQEPFSAYEEERVRREGEAIRSAFAITAPSKFVLDAVRNRLGCSLENAAVIPNAARLLDPARGWRLDRADREEILFVGRFDRIKGADIVLSAFARLAAARPALKLTFAGPNAEPMKIGSLLFSCKEYIGSIMPQDAAQRVSFLGPVPYTALQMLRERAFLTVIGSRIEMSPIVFLEALAAGAPTVATRVGGASEIARDSEEALFAPGEDVDALAAQIARLLDEPEYAARLGVAGRRRVEKDFAPAAVAATCIDYYSSVIDRSRKTKGARRSAQG